MFDLMVWKLVLVLDLRPCDDIEVFSRPDPYCNLRQRIYFLRSNAWGNPSTI